MAKLPTHLTEKQIADLPWLNDADGHIAPRLDVTGHSGQDIAKFRDALYASKIATKEIVAEGTTTYVVAAKDITGVEQHLSNMRLRHISLIDGDGKSVTSYQQFDSKTPLTRADTMFTDLRPEAGARVKNPAALESLKNVFNRLGYDGVEISNFDGKLHVLATEPNAQVLINAGAIQPKNTAFFHTPVLQPVLEPIPDNMASETSPSFKGMAQAYINNNRLNIGLGSVLMTADAALAAAPALEKGEYADAALLALNSSARLATELIVTNECTAGVAAAAAPLSPTPHVYAGTVATGAIACAAWTHLNMSYGDEAMAFIEARVKKVAAGNGLDPNHIWASILNNTKEELAAPPEAQTITYGP